MLSGKVWEARFVSSEVLLFVCSDSGIVLQ
jgi:hypothetical protein